MTADADEAAVQAVDVSKFYRIGRRQLKAVNDVSVTCRRGEFLAIMGPSGAGKSTLANILGGLLKPDKGSVFVSGHDIAKLSNAGLSRFRNQHTGFIFQNYGLIPNYSVLDNVTLPLVISGASPVRRTRKAKECLAAVGLDDYGQRNISMLSGGERQRVAIARALVTNPDFLLADEQTGNLDVANGKVIVELFKRLANQNGHSIVMITHDEQLAARADRQITIRDGRIM